MGSAFIAVDRATRENGCLQVVRGSHSLGRIDHVLTGEQAGADMERVREVLKRQELVHVEMEPGDVLFFHCNTLHRSDQNKSENPALVDDLQLQRRAQRPVQGIAASALYEAHQGAGQPDSRVRGAALHRQARTTTVWLAEERDTTFRNLPR